MNNTDYLELIELSIGHVGVRHPLFQHISTYINKGELIGLFGCNGIGKSTLLKTLSGLLPPVGGKVLLFGHDMRMLSPVDIAKQIAFVPTHPFRIHRLSVVDLVRAGRYGFTNWIGIEQKSDKEAINKALEATTISHLASRDCSTLSDGELQRASIARSLAQNTPIILLDEPTAFLDTGNKYRVVHLLKELAHKEQKGILFSTHDLTLALQVCDILWVMEEDGFYAQTPNKLIEQGVFHKIFNAFGLSFDHHTLGFTLN